MSAPATADPDRDGLRPVIRTRPAEGRAARFGRWLRYRWPTLLIHLLLVAFGLLNLYPFFWMLATSTKEEQESNDHRLKPWPIRKIKLAEDFRLAAVLPTALEPGLDEASGPARKDHLERLEAKLEALHALQRDAWTANVRHQVEMLNVEEDEAYKALQVRLAELEEPFEVAKRVLGNLEARKGETDPAALAAAREALEAARAPYEAVVAEAEKLKTRLRAEAEGRFDRLVEAGVLVPDPEHGSHWLSETAYRGEWPEDLASDPKRAAILEGLRRYFTMTPRDYASAAEIEEREGAEQLAALAAAGAVEEVGTEEGAPAYRPTEGVRGRIYKGLYPGQNLTLWSMEQENTRRHESRETFATNRREADGYAKGFGLVDHDRAARELDELVDAGYAADGTFQWVNYWVVLKEENFVLHFLTSLLITAIVVYATIMVASMFGYALTRIKFPGKLLCLGILITASILPTEARTIPIFRMLLSVGAMQSLWGMVVWMASGGVGQTLLMAGFFWTLPKEVDEAAEVDGAGIFRRFFDIALPMARPVVMTVGLFAFIGAWNNFLVPLLCTMARPSMQPLAVAVYNFQQGHPGKFHQINAAASIMIIPVIIMFLFVQKHVVKAIAVGAVKG